MNKNRRSAETDEQKHPGVTSNNKKAKTSKAHEESNPNSTKMSTMLERSYQTGSSSNVAAGTETLEQRLLRIARSGKRLNVRKAVRTGAGKPVRAQPSDDQGDDDVDYGSANIEPVATPKNKFEDSAQKPNNEKRGAPWNKPIAVKRGAFKKNPDRPELGDMRRIARTSNLKHLERARHNIEFASEQLVQTEVLLNEEAGFIQLEEGERVSDVTQSKLRDMVDVTSATKIFDLSLYKYGPYHVDYSRNGRHLLIGGRKGHVAVIEWLTKRLLCEINVMESVYGVSWLHQETMFAVAQKQWLYMYDNQGVELHCLRQMSNVLRMEFLPYHFLLATGNDWGHLQWLDISQGKMVSNTRTEFRKLDVMCQNPWNATLVCGHHNGTVTMWSPAVDKPLATMLCHPKPVRAVAVDTTGNYMATASHDGYIKMWDVRAMKALHGFGTSSSATSLSFSQRGLLAIGMFNNVQVLKDSCSRLQETPYLYYSVGRPVNELAFCPYEDVLGIGHVGGFSSILVPGSAEANIDTLESNPFQTKTQRRQREVKSLLDKIQPEMICLDPSAITRVENIQPKSTDGMESKFVKPTIELKNKTRGKSDSANLVKRKNIRIDQSHRDFLREELKKRKEIEDKKKEEAAKNAGDVDDVTRILQRFKKKY